MRALVVYESEPAHARETAMSVVRGLADAGVQATAVSVDHAADTVPQSVDLLIVGAPVRPARVPAGGGLADHPRTVRQWLSYAAPARRGTLAVGYDLCEDGPLVVRLDRTSTMLEKSLRRAGFRTAEHVAHLSGATEAELEHARAWGRRLAGLIVAAEPTPN